VGGIAGAVGRCRGGRKGSGGRAAEFFEEVGVARGVCVDVGVGGIAGLESVEQM
jgi:hypothetical protein